jgi:hypothetical protein
LGRDVGRRENSAGGELREDMKGLSGAAALMEWKRVVMNGKSGLDESEFIPLRVSSVISGWESRNRASGGLQCIDVVKERSRNIGGDWN